MAIAAAMLQPMVPVPARPAVVIDHRIACNLFGADGTLGRIEAVTVAESAALARLTMSGSARGIPLPPPRASALSERGTVAVRSSRQGTDYSWIFKVATVAGAADGLVTVASRASSGSIRYVATGICSIVSTKAAYQ